MGQARGARAWTRGLAALSVGASMAGAVTWYGCSIYNSSLLLPAEDSGAKDVFIPDVGTDAHDAGKEAAPSPCPDLEPPTKPAADDPSSNPDQSFVVAVHTIDVGIGDDGGAAASGLIGYDLDNVFTCCDGGPESCTAAVTGSTHCDDPSGRDNSGGHLIQVLASLDPQQFSTSTITQRLDLGTYSILLQVLHYNGQPNDTQVTAALYASAGVEGDGGALWNGMDSWSIDDAFVVSPDASPLLPNHFDGNAYVSGGTLVMHVDFPISLGTSATSTFTISLTAGLITGQLMPSGSGQYALANGNIAGRWNITQLLQALQTVYILSQPICPGTSEYSFIKSEICQYADIMTDPTKDKTGTTCDALSLAMGFSADPALLGGSVPTAQKPVLCNTDAAPDNCGM